mmetsp:Transcript_3291/g.5126  ORF Transcript_3291/g.5126 Transcript_3291/m.5126 type:complete len:745 (+) Transcript_3291:67-2301(+)
MSLLSTWGNKDSSKVTDDEISAAKLGLMSATEQASVLFDALRNNDIPTIRNVLQVNRSLLNQKMFGFEGHDIYGIIPNSKNKRCYSYTGIEKDGYFYPLHVASEMGHKSLIILLVQAGADQSVTDYRGETAEQKANGEGLHAFYELRGLRFQAEEKYEGQLDRSGQRSRNGSLYYKPEGYHETAKLLYRGGWKDNQYHGHGTLYWVGSSNLKYFGRFKNGQFHGSGSLFDQDGEKIYTGFFREGLKDGRGEEYSKGKLIYKGEFSAGARHGFGVAFLSEGHRFMGRFDKGVMAGVGVYFHPNGNRFEGTFFNNKPDGHGTFYEIDPETGDEVSATSAQWTMGRKTKEVEQKFEAKITDIPVAGKGRATPSGPGKVADVRDRSASADNAEEGEVLSGDWKQMLGKYLRLNAKDAKNFDIAEELHIVESEDADGEDEVEDEYNDVDDVNGFHFVENPALFVAYSYVCAAAKTFEERKLTRDFRNLPDFEQIYHLVIDAVDTYNERWEKECKDQEAARLDRERQAALEQDTSKDGKKESYKSSKEKKDGGKSSTGAPTPPPQSPATGRDQLLAALRSGGKKNEKKSTTSIGEETQSKRLVFMSEAEKKEEMLLKQRAELRAKQSAVLLDPEVEAKLGNDILEALEEDIARELELELEVDVEDTETMTGDEGANIDPMSAPRLSKESSLWSRVASTVGDDIDEQRRDDEAIFGNRRRRRTTTKGNIVVVNEFASELLYIMRTATEMLG